jgi:hypothetical protein
MVSLCFYFQQLLKSKNYNICWVLYGEEFKKHLCKWSIKCKNKILDYDNSIDKVKNSDIIIYQNISLDKTLFSNTKILQKIKKNTCKLIQLPSIYLFYDDFDNSIKNLISRENKNNVDIRVSNILYKYKKHNLMLTYQHPNTFLFLKIIKSLCTILNIDFFTKEQYTKYLTNDNYMELP